MKPTPESFLLGPSDERILQAARSMLSKLLLNGKRPPAEWVTVAKLLHALERLPRVTEGIDASVSVCTPTRTFGEIETWHWCDVALEVGTLRMTSGGHFFLPSSGGDTFTTMSWTASPGERSRFSDHRSDLWIVPDICAYWECVERMDFTQEGYKVEMVDYENPWLDEAREELGREAADDESAGAPEESSPTLDPTLNPKDADEEHLADLIDLAEVRRLEPQHSSGAKECDRCGRALDACGFYVDGMRKDCGLWANMCASCFRSLGAGLGWGTGQLYARQPSRQWRLVKGSPPLDSIGH